MLRHLDLFSGIGGFALGLELTWLYQTVAFCEIEAFPRKVLRKHWPDVPCYEDIRDVTADRLIRNGIGDIAILTGGFPCQDISLAGKREGIEGKRSGLWTELFRVITEVRPRWAIIENVPGLRTLGADRVLTDLAREDYAAWPLVVGAVHAGAPHRRQRVWIVAHAQRNGLQRGQYPQPGERETDIRRRSTNQNQPWTERPPLPVLRGVDDGLPCGMDRRKRLTALGNAVVPQIGAAIGRAIVEDPNRWIEEWGNAGA